MLLVDIRGPVALITLNRPEAMNALSTGLRAELDAALRRLEGDPNIRAMVLTGLDLKELGSDPAGMRAANAQETALNPAAAILACKKPVIGAINGVAITGGFELALACDVLVCASNARFADTHARVGIAPGWGLSQRLSRLIGPYRAKQLSLTGNFLDARTAEAWGLVNMVVEPEQLLPTALALAEDMAQIEPDMMTMMKGLIDDGYATSFAEGMALEHARSSAHNAEVTPEMVEARRAAVQARARTQ
jgi:enoyl-CoA hydratase